MEALEWPHEGGYQEGCAEFTCQDDEGMTGNVNKRMEIKISSRLEKGTLFSQISLFEFPFP